MCRSSFPGQASFSRASSMPTLTSVSPDELPSRWVRKVSATAAMSPIGCHSTVSAAWLLAETGPTMQIHSHAGNPPRASGTRRPARPRVNFLTFLIMFIASPVGFQSPELFTCNSQCKCRASLLNGAHGYCKVLPRGRQDIAASSLLRYRPLLPKL